LPRFHVRIAGLVADVTAYTRKKGRPRRHKQPKSREKTPKEGSDSGVGRYHITPSKTVAIGGSIERRETSGNPKGSKNYTRFMGLALKADQFRSGSCVTKRSRSKRLRATL
jgi:hypothetical protein